MIAGGIVSYGILLLAGAATVVSTASAKLKKGPPQTLMPRKSAVRLDT
jgi:hypothetical protein